MVALIFLFLNLVASLLARQAKRPGDATALLEAFWSFQKRPRLGELR
jgi:hypothetical protein